MFDVGWTELLVIAVVLIVVVGPKDLPPMLRAFGKMTARARKVAGDFRAQFDEALREAELDDVRQTIADAQKLNPMNTLREAMNPLREMGNEIKADLQRATTVAPAQSTPVSDQPSSAIGPGDAGSTGESIPGPAAAVPSVPVASTPLTSAQDVQAKPKAGRKPRAASASPAATDIPAAPAKQPGRSKAAASEAVVAASAEKPKRKTARKGATVATETPDAALKPRATAGKKDTA